MTISPFMTRFQSGNNLRPCEDFGEVAAGAAGHDLLDQPRVKVPAVDHHLRATAVADEVLEVEALAVDLGEGVVQDDVDVTEHGCQRPGFDDVDVFGREEEATPATTTG